MTERSADYVENLRVACYKIDVEGLDYALVDGGWVKPETFRDITTRVTDAPS